LNILLLQAVAVLLLLLAAAVPVGFFLVQLDLRPAQLTPLQ
jgi:hypothetical protein